MADFAERGAIILAIDTEIVAPPPRHELTAITRRPDNPLFPSNHYAAVTSTLCTRLGAVALAVLLWSAPGVRAETAASMDDVYDDAVAAFEQGRYEDALDGFLRLRAQGFDEPDLHFNIGSAHYRLRQYDEAEDAFLAAAEDPQLAGLAWYNLALSAYRRGDENTAALAIERALAAASDEEVRSLARILRERLDDPEQETSATTAGMVLAGAGYNDNVTLSVDNETLGTAERGDVFFELVGHLDLRPEALGRRGVVLRGGAYLLGHRSLHEYDTAELQFGAGYEWNAERWLGGVEAQLEQIFLDGRGFTRMASTRLEARRLLDGRRYLELAYEIGAVRAAQPEYRYLAGMRHRLETVFSMRMRDGHALRLGYALEINDRRDVAAPFFTSFSPTRHELRADFTAMLRPRLAARLALQCRHSRYADRNELDDGSMRRRHDERIHLTARLSYLLDGGRDISLELQHTVNESSIPLYDYTRSQYALNVLASW